MPNLFADEVRLKQIVTNLLSNAIKFTPVGGKVTTTVRWNIEDGYVIQISDTGIGIARADIPKVLAPFHQINSCPGRKNEGTGLGLSLSKSLAELHAGSLDLKSEVNVGTVATVRLPANRILSGVAAHSDVA